MKRLQELCQLGAGFGRGARLELRADHHIPAARPQPGDGPAEGVGNAAPVEEVDTTVQGEAHVLRREAVVAARRQAQATQRRRRERSQGGRVQKIPGVTRSGHVRRPLTFAYPFRQSFACVTSLDCYTWIR